MKELNLFEDFLKTKGLKHTSQRIDILKVFLDTEKHLSCDQLYRFVKKKYPSVGYATVYRTLKLLCEAGLSRELNFGDGLIRYEHLYGHSHHDHLICIRCGRFFEVVDPKIEKLQDELAKKYHFISTKHKMDIYGICKSCRR